ALEHAGEYALLVEILMEEEAWQSATTFLPLTDARRDDLTEAIAFSIADDMPDEAIHLLFDLADLRADGKSRPAYARAAQALLASQSLAEATGNEALFRARLRAFLDANARRPALKDEVARQGIPVG
ncbi:MAG: hypothetical protein M3220_08815, partial [Chloroflexota bacterium]|nr:hypothetical protein [Chloroflexota bacterium]